MNMMVAMAKRSVTNGQEILPLLPQTGNDTILYPCLGHADRSYSIGKLESFSELQDWSYMIVIIIAQIGHRIQ